MLISRNWLQSHFTTELPSAEKIAETLMMHSFELEGIELKDTDAIIDIDVLPNRAHDCLSYVGVAREYAVLTGYTLKTDRYHYHDTITRSETTVSVNIENNNQCLRYLARQISNVEVKESPQWLKDRLESIGQRSINNIVDASNYVMFDLGNPIHIFDAEKVTGDITVRNAQSGERMRMLTGEDVELAETDLVIADDTGVLALAGVKGGTKAEVTATTKNIIIEVANFNPATTRTTARRVKILTDSSKRYENGISSEIATESMESISRLITDIIPAESICQITDTYPNPELVTVVEVQHDHINRLLGLSLSHDDVENLFERMNYQVHTDGQKYLVTIPFNRLDLKIPEDIIEEIGRIYGYHNIPAQNLDNYEFSPSINQTVYVENTLKDLLTAQGFSEFKNYTFVKKGSIELANPLATDKRGLRKNLYTQVLENLEKNHHNSDYFGNDRTAVFEIGRIYSKDGEIDQCCIAVMNKGKTANKKYGTERVQLESLNKQINELFGTTISANYEKNSVIFNLSDCFNDVSDYADILRKQSYSENARFHSISPFPYTTRDISLWAYSAGTESDIQLIIESADTEFLKKIFLFDQFEKEGRVSFAYSLVFQSDDETLTDSQVDADMQKITKVLEDNGCEIR